MDQELQHSSSALAMTEHFESCSLTAYRDASGVWTNGYGNTHGVVPNSTVTQEQAVADLQENIQNSVNDINRLVTVQLTHGEFDALVDFDFNLGSGNFGTSTMLKMFNAGNFAGAAGQLDQWDHCDGKVLKGLLMRRESETTEFTGGPAAAG